MPCLGVLPVLPCVLGFNPSLSSDFDMDSSWDLPIWHGEIKMFFYIPVSGDH